MMRTTLRLSPVPLVLLTCTLAACGSEEKADQAASAAPGASTAARPSLSLEVATGLGVMNAHEPLPGLLTAGQITEEQMGVLAGAGYTHFISLRLPDEEGAGWGEAWAAAHGASFTRLPVSGTPDLTRDNVEALDRILDADADGGTVLYCGSSNRVGAMLALRAAWLKGETSDRALELGRAAGMTRLEPAVEELLASADSSGTR